MWKANISVSLSPLVPPMAVAIAAIPAWSRCRTTPSSPPPIYQKHRPEKEKHSVGSKRFTTREIDRVRDSVAFDRVDVAGEEP